MPGRRKTTGFAALLVMCALLFAGLGVWQVQRLQWKLALIESVDRKLAAAPVSLPDRSHWTSLTSASSEYLKVRVSGTYRNDETTLVETLTALGPGYWVMTPLDAAQGPVWINRGFVPKDRVNELAAPGPQTVTVTGLLRLSEPKGRFLRSNRPTEGRWYSRDVDAMSAVHGIARAAPFFIDAERQPGPATYPVGGLTVTTFRNSHLAYALTWFGLAAICLVGLWQIGRRKPAS